MLRVANGKPSSNAVVSGIVNVALAPVPSAFVIRVDAPPAISGSAFRPAWSARPGRRGGVRVELLPGERAAPVDAVASSVTAVRCGVAATAARRAAVATAGSTWTSTVFVVTAPVSASIEAWSAYSVSVNETSCATFCAAVAWPGICTEIDFTTCCASGAAGSITPVSAPDVSVGVCAAASKPGAAEVGVPIAQRQAP